jgi:ribosomal protein L7Ae-like RNA K-turn-binding protein
MQSQKPTWASIVGRSEPKPFDSSPQSRPPANTPALQPAAGGGGDGVPAANRQRLLAEALKSRADAMSGKRWCLSCGRAFPSLSRLAQHLADKHGGVNGDSSSMVESKYTASANLAASGTAGSERAFRLADVAIVKGADHSRRGRNAAPRTSEVLSPPSRDTAVAKPSTSHLQRPKQHVQHKGVAVPPAPQGTRQKRRKRPSKLKRAFNRASAQHAFEHWRRVLSAIEEALLAAREAAGVALEQETSFSGTAESRQACVFGGNEGSPVGRARQRCEHLLELHATAREHLKQAQSGLWHSYQMGEGSGSAKGSKREDTQDEKTAIAAITTDQHNRANAQNEVQVAVSPVRLPRRTSEHGLESAYIPPVAAQGCFASTGEERRGDGASGQDDDDDDDNESSVLGGFQNVLGQWAAQTAAKSLYQRSTGDVKGDASPLARRDTADVTLQREAPSRLEPTIDAKPNVQAPDADVDAESDSMDGDTTSESSEGDGSFELQWGDALLAWAHAAGKDAKEELAHRNTDQCTTNDAAAVGVPPWIPALEENKSLPHHGSSLRQQHDTLEPKSVSQRTQQMLAKRSTSHEFEATHDASAKNSTTAQQETEEKTNFTTREMTASAASSMPPHRTNEDFDSVTRWVDAQHHSPEPEREGDSNTVLDRLDAHPYDLSSKRDAPTTNALGAAVNGGLAFRCELCGISASGPVAWKEHLASRRHARKASQALATGVADVDLTSIPDRHLGNTVAAGVSQTQRCYVGPNADVAPYVDQVITPETNAAVETLLKKLLEWQERVRATDLINFRRKRRVVMGMREVEKAVKGRKAKLLVLAPNVADAAAPPAKASSASTSSGANLTREGRDAVDVKDGGASHGQSTWPVASLLTQAAETEVPVVFAMSRQKLGRLLGGGSRKRVSAIAVLDVSAAETEFNEVLQCAEEGGRAWKT